MTIIYMTDATYTVELENTANHQRQKITQSHFNQIPSLQELKL